MGDKRMLKGSVRGLLLLVFAVFCLPLLGAQESDPDNARVSQTLSWDGSSYALRYELVVIDNSNKEVEHQSLDKTRVELWLKPGKYRYKVLVHNVLDQVEVETAWQDMIVLKAEIPGARKMEPDTMYLETPVLRFKVRGVLLEKGAKYKLYRQDKPQINVAGVEVAHPNTEEVELQFPQFDFSYGDYGLTVENPGGLKRTLKNALKVRYEKPIDLHVSLGWAPSISLYDDWYKEIWDKGFYPLGADARVALIFAKQAEYHLGLELEGQGWLQTGGLPTATINSQLMSGGLNFVYTYLFSKKLRFVGRVGGGLVAGWHSFDYEGIAGSNWSSLDPYASVGLGLQVFFGKVVYVEAGSSFMHVFDNQYAEGILKPQLQVGLAF